MFNECLIHLCDCTCLNVLHLLNLMLIKHKKILSFLIVFGKCFVLKNFKNLCNSILATLPRGLSRSQAPSCNLTQKLLATLWLVKVSVAKKTQKNFKNLGFQHFRDSIWRLVHEWKLQSQVLLKMVHDSLRDLLTGGPSSCEKHLDKFFKICHTDFWQLDLATCLRLILVVKNACFAL